MGRAADHAEWLLQPWELLDLVPRLAAVAPGLATRGCRIVAGNNLGYFGLTLTVATSDLRSGKIAPCRHRPVIQNRHS